MEKVILIRYGEIHLKGRNRSFFENLLVSNIKAAVKPYGAVLSHTSGRYILSNFDEKNANKLSEVLKNISGIVSFSLAIVCASVYDQISNVVIDLSKDLKGTFKIEANRADKTFPIKSPELAKMLGGVILDNNTMLSVDCFNPNHTINVDIRENNKTYIYLEKVLGMGGMPVGSAGKGVLLLSGGIDSPVAGYMMAKRGVNLVCLHFHSFPYTSPQAQEKVEALAKILAKYDSHLTLKVISVTKIQEEIHKKCNPNFMITLLRRFMFRIAEIVAKNEQTSMIITGESLGQVASQTIESMTVVESVLKDSVVLRPLVAFDKNETIEIARKINSYKTSIIPYEDCCTVFLPKNPLTKPRLDKVIFEESKLDVDSLINEAINSIKEVKIN
ncbi:MAG: tRNA 4-thiouridine(8) synthase ThiI [Clostridia bacterium]|nr:tRNA 4-thiouridine(8) synthase ThiI [Clostridia bacterium]